MRRPQCRYLRFAQQVAALLPSDIEDEEELSAEALAIAAAVTSVLGSVADLTTVVPPPSPLPQVDGRSFSRYTLGRPALTQQLPTVAPAPASARESLRAAGIRRDDCITQNASRLVRTQQPLRKRSRGVVAIGARV